MKRTFSTSGAKTPREVAEVFVPAFAPKILRQQVKRKHTPQDLEQCIRTLSELDPPYRQGVYMAAVEVAKRRAAAPPVSPKKSRR